MKETLSMMNLMDKEENKKEALIIKVLGRKDNIPAKAH
jgi:hypothetical protein